MKSKLIRAFALAFYYGIAQYLPDSYQPLMGGGCPRTTDHKSEILQSVSSSDDSCLSYGNNYQLLGDNTSNPSSATYNLKVENSQN